MPDFKGFIANCLIGGDEITREKDGGWVRNRLTLQLGGFDLDLIQHPDVVSRSTRKLQGRSVHTTDVIVKDIKKEQIPRLEVVLKDLSWLLSLAGLSEVQYFGYEYPYGTGYGTRTNVYGKAREFIPIIQIRNGRAVKAFLQQVYPSFKRLEKVRRIPETIHYLLEAEKTAVIEIRLLIIFSTLEGLKDTYARAEHIPYIKGTCAVR